MVDLITRPPQSIRRPLQLDHITSQMIKFPRTRAPPNQDNYTIRSLKWENCLSDETIILNQLDLGIDFNCKYTPIPVVLNVVVVVLEVFESATDVSDRVIFLLSSAAFQLVPFPIATFTIEGVFYGLLMIIMYLLHRLDFPHVSCIFIAWSPMNTGTMCEESKLFII